MLLKAGALSLALLLASRVLGLLRESALAATFGASGLADVAVLMLTLPDWLVGVLASGALGYVLLPAWVGREPQQVAASQRRVAQILLAGAVLLGLLLMLLREPAIGWLAGGLPPAARPAAGQALVWSALALPAALLAALWTTRLQHERDFLGMYSSGIVVNLVLLAAIALAALGTGGMQAVGWLGWGLLAAMLLRLAWLRWRQGPVAAPVDAAPSASLPRLGLWLWAVLSAGLPLALPFAARSLASQSGEGALATFNYAWKLVELPLVLAIQLVASLAFPAIATALAGAPVGGAPASAGVAVRSAFALAFALACACAAGLVAGAPALAQLLFGWGRMEPEALVRIAQWARTGAWSLLPQAVIAVALTVLAAQGRMRTAVFAYALALAAFLAIGAAGVRDGGALMVALNCVLAAVAAATVVALGPQVRQWLPWGVLAAALAVLLGLTLAVRLLPVPASIVPGLALAVAAACAVLGASWLAGSGLRAAARDN
ncbi:lipid II flippase MurJ [Caenimonas terrae]|uniref:Lipid II flippase MurJ n=1 Tax=Caenimonas terrae TaxID=696074 RepID=A0ABW0NI87_9BURK